MNGDDFSGSEISNKTIAMMNNHGVDPSLTVDGLLLAARGHYFAKEMPRGDQTAAYWLLRNRHVKTNQQGKIFAYNDQLGHYRAEGETMLKADMVRAFGPIANRTRVGETIAKVQALSYCNNDDLEASTPPNLIPLDNGIYDLETHTLQAHSPDHFFTYKHPVKYDPQATCEEFLRFLSSSIATDKEREILLDIIALSLYRARVTRKFFVLVGNGHNGKSIFISVVRELIGRNRVVSIAPQAIAEDTFAASQLYDKHANMGADIPGGYIRDFSTVRNATGGDAISMQRKGVDREDREVYCEFVWASNEPPRIAEDTHAMWDRVTVVTFPYTFKKIPIAENEKLANPDLEKLLKRPEELSGILNLALKRLPTLLERRDLSVDIDPQEVRKQYRMISDTAAVWVEECCEEVDFIPGEAFSPSSGYVTATEAYRHYRDWCEKGNLHPVSLTRFGKAMEALGFERGKDAQVRSYRGLRIIGPLSQLSQLSSILGSTFTETIEKEKKDVKALQPVPVTFENCGFCKKDALRAIQVAGGSLPMEELERLFPGEPVTDWLKELATNKEVMEIPCGTWRALE